MASTNSSMNNSHGVQKLNANQLQKRLTAILDNAGDGLITINANGIIQVFNASCQRIFGYSQE